MDLEEILEKVIEILKEQFSYYDGDITSETTLMDDLGADSLDVAEVIQSIEDEFNFEVMEENVENMHTVGDIASYIEEHMS